MPKGGNFEQIAKVARLEPGKVWRRLKELEDADIIVTNGNTHPTSSGRQAMVRVLNKVA